MYALVNDVKKGIRLEKLSEQVYLPSTLCCCYPGNNKVWNRLQKSHTVMADLRPLRLTHTHVHNCMGTRGSKMIYKRPR